MEEDQIPISSQVPENKPAGFKVEGIFLKESLFIKNLDEFNPNEITTEITFSSQAQESTIDNKFAVTVSLVFNAKQSDIVICTSNIKMMGIFEKYGDPAISDEMFKSINAPAIIYPFIREHLFSLCLKAGIANMLLPTVNFKP